MYELFPDLIREKLSKIEKYLNEAKINKNKIMAPMLKVEANLKELRRFLIQMKLPSSYYMKQLDKMDNQLEDLFASIEMEIDKENE